MTGDDQETVNIPEDVSEAAETPSEATSTSSEPQGRFIIDVVKEPYFTMKDPTPSEEDPTDQPQDIIPQTEFKLYRVRNLDFNINGTGKLEDSKNLIAVTNEDWDRPYMMSYQMVFDGGLVDKLAAEGSLLSSEYNNKKGPGSITEKVCLSLDNLKLRDRYTAVMFNRDGLVNINGSNHKSSSAPETAFVSENGMMFRDPISSKLTTIPAFRNVNGITSSASNLPAVQGDEQEFNLFLQEMLKDLPKLQIILGYEISGPLRQYLSMHGKALGELSSVLCITGNPGTGKTIATTTLKAVLFGTAGTISANNTTIGLGRTVEQSGISPVIVDDASVVNKKASEVVEELYHLANGECRVTAQAGQQTRPG